MSSSRELSLCAAVACNEPLLTDRHISESRITDSDITDPHAAEPHITDPLISGPHISAAPHSMNALKASEESLVARSTKVPESSSSDVAVRSHVTESEPAQTDASKTGTESSVSEAVCARSSSSESACPRPSSSEAVSPAGAGCTGSETGGGESPAVGAGHCKLERKSSKSRLSKQVEVEVIEADVVLTSSANSTATEDQLTSSCVRSAKSLTSVAAKMNNLSRLVEDDISGEISKNVVPEDRTKRSAVDHTEDVRSVIACSVVIVEGGLVQEEQLEAVQLEQTLNSRPSCLDGCQEIGQGDGDFVRVQKSNEVIEAVGNEAGDNGSPSSDKTIIQASQSALLRL